MDRPKAFEQSKDMNEITSSSVAAMKVEGDTALAVNTNGSGTVENAFSDEMGRSNSPSTDDIDTPMAASSAFFDVTSKNDSLDVTDDSFMAAAALYESVDAKIGIDNENVADHFSANMDPSSHPMPIAPQSDLPSTSVTAERKEQLLLEARLDRLHWIQQVPLPYQVTGISCSDLSMDQSSNTEVQQFINMGQVTHHVPSVIPVLRHLYGNGNLLNRRMETELLLKLNENDTSKLHLLTGTQVYMHEMDQITDDDTTTKSILLAYHALMQLLPDPALSVLVQGIRNFVRALDQPLVENTQPTTTTHIAKFHAYLQSIVETLQHHVLYNKNFVPKVESNPLLQDCDPLILLRRSMESFVFGHSIQFWDQVIDTPETIVMETKFQEKLQLLQFVTPVHLDIHCFSTTSSPNYLEEIRALLSRAISALQTMNAYFSAYEKLQCILLVYKEINTALTEALAQASLVEKLPSADDILPTFILIILYAQPKRLFYNLQFIEQLALPEYLRGEAGYAYTNLYGAYQFLQDLDLTEEPSSLSISAEALQEALLLYKSKADQNFQTLNPPESTATIDSYIPMSTNDWDNIISSVVATPTPLDIRRARIGGQVIDLDWAVQWQKQQSDIVSSVSTPALHRKNSSMNLRSVIETVEEGLPSGFRRNYNFLTVKSPDDIRYSDISQLLKEYHMLVRTTETLLSERVMKVSADRKAQMRAREHRFVSTAQSFDTAADLL